MCAGERATPFALAPVHQMALPGGNATLSGLLQDRLIDIIHAPVFKPLSRSEILGTFEFLKWNYINWSD